MLLLLVVCATCTTFTACSSSDDDDDASSSGGSATTELADYTLLIYGSAGGNLDDYLQYTLSQIGLAAATENVNVAAVVKYSKDQQDSIATNLRGTPYFRRAAGTRGLTVTTYADASYDITDADNFAEVVDMVVEDLPAKKYILILWDHGQSFNMYDTPLSTSTTASAASSTSSTSSTTGVTRSFITDDNISDGTIMSVFSLAEGIRLSTVDKFEAIIASLCLFNNVEQLYELQPYCNYVMGSASFIPAVGYDYATLLSQLNSSSSDVATALTATASSTMTTWETLSGFKGKPMEVSVFDMSVLPTVVSALGDVCGRYKTLYSSYASNPRYINILKNAQLSCQTESPVTLSMADGTTQTVTWEYGGPMYYYDSQVNRDNEYYIMLSFTSADVLSTFVTMEGIFNDSQLTTYVDVLRTALDNMTVSMVKKDFPTSVDENICGLSIIWIDKQFYENSYRVVEMGNYYSYVSNTSNTFSDTYPYTAFDKETNWSEYFSMYDTPYAATVSGGRFY